MSRRWIISILILWGFLVTLVQGMQANGPSEDWLERAEALEPAAPQNQHGQAGPTIPATITEPLCH